MLGYVYGHNHVLNINQDLGVKVAAPIGNLFGQILFGWLADVLGRKRMCMSQVLICYFALVLICDLQMALSS
jgi:PHS family inorganic phosphate transporter-like MFS transporter